jgi:hypothetical protein
MLAYSHYLKPITVLAESGSYGRRYGRRRAYITLT